MDDDAALKAMDRQLGININRAMAVIKEAYQNTHSDLEMFMHFLERVGIEGAEPEYDEVTGLVEVLLDENTVTKDKRGVVYPFFYVVFNFTSDGKFHNIDIGE